VSLDKDCCLESYTDAYHLGRADELKRIVALLEDRLEFVDCEGLGDSKRRTILRVGSLIDIIKGESE
jgi:hypothetical protein